MCSYTFLYILFVILVSKASAQTSGSVYHAIDGQCNQNIRVMFMVDGSDSISPSNFDTFRTFVARTIRSLNVYANAQVSVMVFSDRNRYTNFVDWRQFAWDSSFTQPGLRTNTADALRTMISVMTQQRFANTARVAIILSDGLSISPAETLRQAQLARDSGVTLVTIGIGIKQNTQELQTIASPGLFFGLGSFVNLNSLNLVWKGRNCFPTTPPAVTTCPALADVVWVIDLSDSIHAMYVDLIKTYVVHQSYALGLGTGVTGIGYVTFSDRVVAEFPPSFSTTVSQFRTAVNGIVPVQGGTNTAAALATMTTLLLQTNRQVEKIAILITDGRSLNPQLTQVQATNAKQRGIRIAVIGVGNDAISNSEFAGISSPSLIYRITGFNNLQDINLSTLLQVQRSCQVVSTPNPWTWPTTRRPIWTWPTTRRPIWTWPTTRRPVWTWPTTRRPIWTWPTTRRTIWTWFTTRRPIWTQPTPVLGTTRQPPSVVCAGCKISGGYGWKNHPTSCDKFIRCILDRTTSSFIDYEIMDCPLGLFWDINSLTCNWPSEVTCNNDQCRRDPRVTTYGYSDDCRAYWICRAGRTISGRCCRINTRYSNLNGPCIPGTCTRSKRCSSTTNPIVCNRLRRHPSVLTMYQQRLSDGNWIDRYCAPGTAYTASLCRCNTTVPVVTRAPTRQVCTGPEVYLPLDRDFTNARPNRVYINVKGAVIERVAGAVGGGAARFSGASYISIPRFNNIDWPAYMRIEFRYRPVGTAVQTRNLALVTNGNCNDQPSIAISLNQNLNSVAFMARTSHTQYNSFSTNIRATSNGWTAVRFIYDRRRTLQSGRATAYVDNNQPFSSRLEGLITRTKSDLLLGHGEGFANFTGYIDEFYVYLCDPPSAG